MHILYIKEHTYMYVCIYATSQKNSKKQNLHYEINQEIFLEKNMQLLNPEFARNFSWKYEKFYKTILKLFIGKPMTFM